MRLQAVRRRGPGVEFHRPQPGPQGRPGQPQPRPVAPRGHAVRPRRRVAARVHESGRRHGHRHVALGLAVDPGRDEAGGVERYDVVVHGQPPQEAQGELGLFRGGSERERERGEARQGKACARRNTNGVAEGRAFASVWRIEDKRIQSKEMPETGAEKKLVGIAERVGVHKCGTGQLHSHAEQSNDIRPPVL